MKIFNRYKKSLEEEQVPCKRWLQFLYGNFIGNLFLNLVFKKSWFSRILGFFTNLSVSRNRIQPFCKKYHICIEDFEIPQGGYKNFNAFFSRKLKPHARSFCTEPHIGFPADGRHLGFQNIDIQKSFSIKGRRYSLEQLLDNRFLAERFQGGTCIISRLAPTDYHRFHFPYSGIPQKTCDVNGALYSVHPIALKKSFRIFEENKRCITVIDSEHLGAFIMIEVGATCVGSIQQTFTPNLPVSIGTEKGYFALGGSTVITLFEHNRIILDEDLLYYSQQNIELYAKVGDHLGHVNPQFQ